MRRTSIPAKARRFVFIHHHIMKNAGSTIAAILAREFRAGYHDMDSDNINGDFTTDDVTEYLLENPHINALTSHQIRFPRIEHPDLIAFECCIVRHPLDRLYSLYRYLLTKDTNLALGRIACETDLGGFLRHLVDREPHLVCNVQTSLIANGGRFTRPADADDLARAIETLRKISVPGVVNHLDHALVSAEYYLQPAFPDLKLHSRPENVTKSSSLPMAERERQFRTACGESLFADIRRMQELDFQLFHATEEEVRRRAELVPQFSKRLAEFQARTRNGLAATTAA